MPITPSNPFKGRQYPGEMILLAVRWYLRYAERSFSAGVETVMIDQVPVRVYSAEKTIADCFKYRNRIGLEMAVEGLRVYRERKRRPDIKALTNLHNSTGCSR